MRFFCAGVTLTAVSPRSMMMESSNCVYRGRQAGFTSDWRSPVLMLSRPMLPP